MLDEGARRGEIWNGGLPDALLLDADGSVRERFPSQHVPLGIADGPGDMAPRPFAWDGASQLVICSDGLIEAGDADGRMFGAERLETLLRATPAAQRFDAVQATLAEHMGEVQATDDLSLVIVDCRG